MVSSMNIDFSNESHFTEFGNSSSEDEISLNLIDSLLDLYLRARTFKSDFFSRGSLQTGNI